MSYHVTSYLLSSSAGLAQACLTAGLSVCPPGAKEWVNKPDAMIGESILGRGTCLDQHKETGSFSCVSTTLQLHSPADGLTNSHTAKSTRTSTAGNPIRSSDELCHRSHSWPFNLPRPPQRSTRDTGNTEHWEETRFPWSSSPPA
ncbi:hypothetical protein QBC33DRAFT_532793 [Phialemonium atrogriseum]|uniref:Ig-like domain-containing protein n=1 Tax=Phialemonium atrogriseum TaxID=1093897 RepID=A0AAJ0C3I6_9PEZI|nr:uncharacterized protein QBC33DRAFT_532793 [Phialemonium atrogriseum]KAK1769261.1 hypothetical protein QBC33DRAFT_532793 [Phialemonium atrogriseum]